MLEKLIRPLLLIAAATQAATVQKDPPCAIKSAKRCNMSEFYYHDVRVHFTRRETFTAFDPLIHWPVVDIIYIFMCDKLMSNGTSWTE